MKIRLKNSLSRRVDWPLVDSRAKQSQDDKPLKAEELVRTASVESGLRSHPSLRSRRGMKVSATWPPLTGLSSVLPVTARPFGLGFRYDEAPSGSGLTLSRQTFRTNPRKFGLASTLCGRAQAIGMAPKAETRMRLRSLRTAKPELSALGLTKPHD